MPPRRGEGAPAAGCAGQPGLGGRQQHGPPEGDPAADGLAAGPAALTCSPAGRGWCTAPCRPCCSSPAARARPRSSGTPGSCGPSRQRSRSPPSRNPSNVGQGVKEEPGCRMWCVSTLGRPRPVPHPRQHIRDGTVGTGPSEPLRAHSAPNFREWTLGSTSKRAPSGRVHPSREREPGRWQDGAALPQCSGASVRGGPGGSPVGTPHTWADAPTPLLSLACCPAQHLQWEVGCAVRTG